jgi:hypothetical protein
VADVVVEIVRPEDMLVAKVTLHNLRFSSDKLVRDAADQSVGISVELPRSTTGSTSASHRRSRLGLRVA